MRSVPAAVLARTCFARRTISTTLVLMRSTFRKSARMPSSMICWSILTMWAWRILRRFTTSVICIRDRSSLACACTAKMLTSLVSRSSTISRGRSLSGRGELLQNPCFVRSAEIFQFVNEARSDFTGRVIRDDVTFSPGWMRRHTLTALRAPGVSSGSNGSVLSCCLV